MAKLDSSISVISNLLGFILSAATAYVYEFVHRAKNIEEKCIVHLSVSLAITEFVIFISFIEDDDIYSSRISDAGQFVTIFALSSFLWSLILAFHTRKKFIPRSGETSANLKSNSSDSELMKKYLLIGYGIPFLVLTCYWGGVSYRARDFIALAGVYAIIAITVLNGLIFYNLTKDLSRQIDNAQLSLTSDNPVKVDIRQLEYKLQFAQRLYLSLVLPWLMLYACIFLTLIMTLGDSSIMTTLTMIGPTFLIGLQGIALFCNMVLLRKRIWRDLKSEYGWQKPTELNNLEHMFGYVSEEEDDNEEKLMNSQTRYDFLAMIDHLRQKEEPTKEEANQLPSSKVFSEKETRNMQPAIHQYVGRGGPGAADQVDPTKLTNESV